MPLFKQTILAFGGVPPGSARGTKHVIRRGDSRCMKPVSDCTAQLMATSPPYWQIKDYGDPAQIGRFDSFGAYIDNLNMVWSETARVLLPGGVAAVNVGDQYARAAEHGRFKVISIQSEIIRAFEHLGLDYRGTIIWQKVTNTATSGGGAMMGSFPYPPNGVPKFDYEYILLFKKPGAPPKRTPETREASKLTPEEWKDFFTGHWIIPPEKQTLHPAPFPPELPARLIKMFSFAGDTVLDPFLGSGTTSVAAAALGRNSIGFEIGAEYCEVAKRRIEAEAAAAAAIKKSDVDESDLAAVRDSLPYRVSDYVRLERLPEDRIKRNAVPELLRIKGIRKGFFVKLSDGRVVHLAGVKEIPARAGEIVGFIMKKGRRGVFYKVDRMRPEWSTGVPNVYLIAANKTNINWHLIRERLCRVDESQEFEYKEKYLRKEWGQA